MNSATMCRERFGGDGGERRYAPACIEATGLGKWLSELVERRHLRFAAAGVLVGCLGVGWASSNRFWQLTILTHSAHEPLVYPCGAVDYLRQAGFAGNLIVPFNTGAFVSWKLYPKVKVSFGSRYEATYPHGALEENFDFFAGREGWQKTLTRHGADSVLVRRISPLDEMLGASGGPQWRRVYHDDDYSVFVSPDRARRMPVVDRAGVKIVGQFP